MSFGLFRGAEIMMMVVIGVCVAGTCMRMCVLYRACSAGSI
jgi:hypothetical protein